MTITINMLDKSKIKYNWETLYVGISVNLVEVRELTNYALKIMDDDKYEYDEFINELAWGEGDRLKCEILTKMLLKFNLNTLIPKSASWNLEIRKLRYSMLNYLRSTIEDYNELLRKLEEVYADFNYPQDMEEFIEYMPSKDNLSLYSIEDNKKYMINNLDKFLTLEEKELNEK